MTTSNPNAEWEAVNLTDRVSREKRTCEMTDDYKKDIAGRVERMGDSHLMESLNHLNARRGEAWERDEKVMYLFETMKAQAKKRKLV